MKRNILILAAVFVAGTVMSQDLTSKKGELYLPEAGDYAIGIDAAPFLNYFGNFIGGNGLNAAPTFNSHPLVAGGGATSHTIAGKMVVDANTAYRANVRIGFTNATTKTMVADATSSDPDAMVEDKSKVSNMGINLGAGLEKRRGNTRLQGIYGAQAQLALTSGKTTNEFGNAIADVGGSRVTENKQGSTFTFGVAGFAGVEYFFAPKMSVGGEYLWGLAISSTGAGEVTTETTDGSTTTENPVSTSFFGLDTATMGAANLMMTFYF